MSLKELIFKPRWQHKNPAVRASAVASESDPRLIEALESIAGNDEDAAVRLAAVRRLEDPMVLLSLVQSEPDDSVREHLMRTLRQFMSGHARCDVADRLAIFQALADPELSEWLVGKARDTELRRAALEKIERDSLLGDVAIGDDDPGLRLQAAKRVQTESTLERVAREVRRRDKRVFRLVSDRLQARRLESGDQSVVREIAESLCTSVEKLVRSDDRAADKATQLKSIEQQWQALNRPPDDLSARFLSALRIVEASLANPDDDPDAAQRAEVSRFCAEARARLGDPEPSAIQNLITQGQSLLDRLEFEPAIKQLGQSLADLVAARDQLIADAEPTPELLSLCLKAERLGGKKITEPVLTGLRSSWHAQWSSMSSHRPADQMVKKRFDSALQNLANLLAERAERTARAAARLPEMLDALEAALDKGDLSASAAALSRCLDDLKSAAEVGPALRQRLNDLRSRVRELRDWQHWSNNEMRQRLVDRATELAGSGLHPDAVTERLKELNARWKELDKSEHLPGDAANRVPNPKLFRQFRAACDQAFEPARVFFEKRSQVREQHQEELEKLCQELEKADGDMATEDLERLVRKGRGGLRRLSEVAPQKRSSLARRLRSEADRIDALLDDHYAVVERRKQALIDEVTALIEEPDLDKAINTAKDAQRKWQAAGRTRRTRDQKLWKRYRAAADQVFARLDAQRDADKSARKEQLEQLDSLLAQARDAMELETTEARGRLRALRQQMSEVAFSSRRHQQDLSRLEETLDQREETEAREARLRSRRARRELAALCTQQEQRLLSAEPIQADQLQAALGHCDPPPPEGLEERVRAALEAQPPTPELLEQQARMAQALCIEMEFLAGTPSPDEWAEQRMAYQVKRLSERMGGAAASSAIDEAEEIECRWLACGPLPADQAEGLTRRFMKALQAFEGEA